MRRLLLAATLLLIFPAGLAAHDFKVGDITADHPWARATAGQAPNGAAYMTLTNAGETADFLTGASGDVAERIELHTHNMVDGVMQMRPVEKMQVAPGEPTVLRPGGLHIMLIGLKAPLKQGEMVPLTLTFEKAGTLEIEVAVESVGAMEPAKQ
ncbi:MAG: copper chaperone PCu(A)C [Rhodospirillales bacterium]